MEMAETRTITTRYFSIPGSRFDRRGNYVLPARWTMGVAKNLRVSTAYRVVAVDRPCVDRRCAALKEDAGGGDEPDTAPMNYSILR
jgi:hypothetical protein